MSFSGVVRFLLGVENCLLLFQVYVRIMCKLCHFSYCIYSTDKVLCICQLKKTLDTEVETSRKKFVPVFSEMSFVNVLFPAWMSQNVAIRHG